MIGYGNSVFLRRSFGPGIPPVDPDAQAFITAAAITDPTQQAAINTLVVNLKGYNVWSKMKAIYPFCGSTASQHKFNLKNPLNTNAAFRLVFNGGFTHSSNGVTANGTNGYAETFLTPSLSLTINNTSIATYSRTNSAIDAVDIGSDSGVSSRFVQHIKWSNNDNISDAYDFTNDRLIVGLGSTSSQGLFIVNRTSVNVLNSWRNSVKLGTNTNTRTSTLPTIPLFLMARNNAGFATNYSNRQYAFASIGDGLTDTEAANFYTAVQNFQVSLGRSIGTQTVSDADAQAFVTNAGIVDQVEANAINNLVIGMKADGTWSKMKGIYPFVGGTAVTHKWNLKNPLDTNAAHRILWSGGVTHSSNGVQFGGVNGYGDVNLNLTALNKDNIHFSFYSRTNNTTQAFDMGQTGFSGNAFSLLTHYSNVLKGSIILSATGSDALAEATYTNTTGLLIGTRQNSNNVRIFRNAVKTESNTNNSVATIDSGNIFIGARNQLVLSSAANYTNRQAAFISIGDNLTDTEATNLNTRVTTFQTALNRNI